MICWFKQECSQSSQSVIECLSGADPGRGENGSSHGQIFSTLEYFALNFLKILD